MDRVMTNNKKRSRIESEDNKPRRIPIPTDPWKRSKSKIEIEFDLLDNESSVDHPRPLSIFEFPWKKEMNVALLESSDNGCDLRDVFFSSLVDGCKAAIGVPGDRLSPSPAPISLPSDLDLETDGVVDCIWSCVLREPLPLPCLQH